MEVLRFCPDPRCKECTISEQFNVGHLKMLYIQCLPINTDIINVLISLLIDVSSSFNDLILKTFKGFIVPLCGWRYEIQYLDIASKKALFHANIYDLYNDGFDVVAPDALYEVDRSYRCWLQFSDSNVKMDWKFCHLLSHPIEFWFGYTNNKKYVRSARIFM